MKINYLIGDATNPQGGVRCILHVCNDVGGWGRGFVLALSAKWKEPEQNYRMWAKTELSYKELTLLPSCKPNFKLGEIQVVKVEEELFVINMIAQHGIYPENGIPPARLDALESCLNKVYNLIKDQPNTTIHMPRICAGLGGLNWEDIEPVIIRTLTDKNVEVNVYDLPIIKYGEK
jgi:O-acetyl-ADP-ribose deacetylase (regulator of RNase III)